MTEDEWLVCVDPSEMFKFLKGRVSERKLRLASGQFYLRSVAADTPAQPWDEPDVVMAEWAKEASDLGRRPENCSVEPKSDSLPSIFLHVDAYVAASGTWVARRKDIRNVIFNHHYLNSDFDAESFAAMETAALAFDTTVAALLREIFGNPFHSSVTDSEWRTDTVLALAQQMYDSRDFGAMPIIADALQDAGCDDDAILDHCRDANAPHVRGCWVVDLVLGKE